MNNPGLMKTSIQKLFWDEKRKDNGKMITLNTILEPSIIKGDLWLIRLENTRNSTTKKQYKNINMMQKAIFKITNKLLFKDESLPLLPELNIKLLAENFKNFFTVKIDRIWDDLTSTKNNTMDNTCIEDHYLTDHQLIRFQPVDEDSIAKPILRKHS